MRKLFVAVAVGIVSLFTNPASAADDTVIDYFTADNVVAVMKDLGAANVETETDKKFTFVYGQINGYNLSLGIDQCEDRPGCMGLFVAAVFAADNKQFAAQTLVDFTGKFPPTPAIQLSGGNKVALVRAIISLGGIRTGNLKYNIGLLVVTLPLFAEHLNNALVASNQYGAPLAHALHSERMTPAEMHARSQILTASMASELGRWPAPIRRH